MKRSSLTAVLGLGIALTPWALGQAPAGQAPAEHSPEVVPAAQQPTSEQLTRLFEVMRIKEQMASASRMMPQLMQQQFTAQVKQMQKDHPEMQSLSPEQQQAYSKVMSKYMNQAMTLYTTDEMMADMGAVYRKHLSGADVDGIIAFYRSPAGQHMLDMTPAIMQEFMPQAMERMQSKMQPLILEMQKELVEILHKN